jgi:hypothetical protein
MQTNLLIKDSQSTEHYLEHLYIGLEKCKNVNIDEGGGSRSSLLDKADEMDLASALVALNCQFLKGFAVHMRVNDGIDTICCVFG